MEHEYFDVKKNVGLLKELLALSQGRREVPVIVEGARVRIGFGGT